jgi:Metallo-peptidase family M12B Reprolysin-like
MNDWPFIGIKEGWIENGWTPEQMMKRSLEIKIPPQSCYLQPYYMNFLQQPNLNSLIKKQVEETQSGTGAAWISSNRLWTPGQTINIIFSPASPADMQNFVKFCIMKYAQPHISMKLNFTNDTAGDILINIAYMSSGGGNSAIGKSGRQQTINLNVDRFKGKTDTSKLTDTANTYSSGKFNLQRYLVLHEFGHALGLYHEWQRENCGKNGVTCSDSQDMNSIMNYFNLGTTGVQGVKPSKETMDSYSPGDISWLQKVYGGKGASGPVDLRQLGIIQNWPDDLSDVEVERRVNHFLSITPQHDIVQDERLNSASECLMYPLVLNYKQDNIDAYERVVSTPPTKYWPSTLTQLNIWFDRGTSTQHDSIKKWLIDNLQPHIRMNLVFEKAATGIVYTVVPPEEMGARTNPSNGQSNWVPAGTANSIGYSGARVYTIKLNSGRGVKKSTVLHEICHILGLYHSFDACKQGGECVKTDGDASIMSYVSPPEKGFSPVDIEWLRRVYGPGGTGPTLAPFYQFDLQPHPHQNYLYILSSIFIIIILIIIVSR